MEKYCLALLCNMEGFGISKIAILLKRFDNNAGDIWRASVAELCEVGLEKNIAESIAAQRGREKPEKLADFCEKENVSILSYYDNNYPEELLNTGRAPLALFVKGNLPVKQDRIAIVGSRKSSSYGLSVTRQFSADLARAGFTIISGGAKGVDTEAHKGALTENGRTVAVFGCGIDVCYPKENERLYEDIIAENGALVTEYLPGAEPLPWRFPARNRIISGLSKGVLVVEANKKSGSLITANFAVESGREVYCVPGSIYSAGSAGVHNLIKQGAKLVDRPEDIISDLGGLFAPQAECLPDDNLGSELEGNAKMIYEKLLPGKQYSTDEIIDMTGLVPAVTAFSLLEMEIAGWIDANAGAYQLKERKIG